MTRISMAKVRKTKYLIETSIVRAALGDSTNPHNTHFQQQVAGGDLFSSIYLRMEFITYGSLVFTGGFGNPRATFSYKSGGSPQSSRRRVCTSVNGDSMACVCPLTSTTLTLIVFIAPSSNSALGRAVLRPG